MNKFFVEQKESIPEILIWGMSRTTKEEWESLTPLEVYQLCSRLEAFSHFY